MKELKDLGIKLYLVFAGELWNPVKELKIFDLKERRVCIRGFVESGEGIESVSHMADDSHRHRSRGIR